MAGFESECDMGPIQSFAELRDFLLRRLNLIMLAFGVALLATVFLALRSTPEYQSVAVLSTRVDAVTDAALQGSGTGSAARLMQLIEQRLTARDTMLQLADEFDMFVGRPAQERADLMRGSITLMSQAAVSIGFAPDGALASMIIMARSDTGPKAAAMANTLAEMVLSESDAGRFARARQTLEFHQSEFERLSAELAAVQQQSRDFMAENYEVMSVNADMRRAEMSQIAADMQDLRRELAASEAELAAMAGQSTGQRRQIQLRDVITRARAELERLEDQQLALEPFFRRSAQAERDLEILTNRETRLLDRVREVSAQVEAAERALRIESESRGATFEVVEEATIPEYPMSRSRKSMVMMGGVAGIFLGVLGAFAYEVLRPALRSARQVERELGMRPVLVLPALVLPAERRKRLIGWSAGACLFALALIAIVLSQPAL